MPYQHSRSSSLSGIEKRISESHIRIPLLWLVGLGFTIFFFSLSDTGKKKSPTTTTTTRSPFAEGKTQRSRRVGHSLVGYKL